VTPLRLFVLVALCNTDRPDKRTVQVAARALPPDFPLASARLMRHLRRLNRVLRDLRMLGLIHRREIDTEVLFEPTDRVRQVLANAHAERYDCSMVM